MGSGGGAGGGALLIASSMSITVNGTIQANGGLSNTTGLKGSLGGHGSGGAIRLVASTINMAGVLSVAGESNTRNDGRARLEAFQIAFPGTFLPRPDRLTLASPFGLYLPTASSTPSSIRAVGVNGVAVPPNPTGSFTIPDVTINQSTAVTVEIETHNIPLGTVAKVYFLSENGADQLIDSTPLTGTLSASTATVSVTLPPGFSRGFVQATWANP